MRIVLVNSLGCELDGWSSPHDLANAILLGQVILEIGDSILFQDDLNTPDIDPRAEESLPEYPERAD